MNRKEVLQIASLDSSSFFALRKLKSIENMNDV